MTDTAALVTIEAWEPEDTFGARLALIRQRFHWNVTEASAATGIPAATWTKWEEGSQPRDYIGTCEKIAASVGCSTKWLVEGHRNWKLMTGPDLRLCHSGPLGERRDSTHEQLRLPHLTLVPT